MGFSMNLVQGADDSVMFSESAGMVSLSGSLDAQLGGGSVAGVVKIAGSATVSVGGAALLSALFALIESKSPAGAVVIEKEVQAAALALLAST